MKTIEKSYSFVFRNFLRAVNPLKKKIIKTECEIHRFINSQALKIIKGDSYLEEAAFFNEYSFFIDEGSVWVDQDFKSSNHFYNPYTRKGLYGNSNAMRECILYYTKALNYFLRGNIKKSMFYLGAVNHLVQDMAVPQHVNVKLLDNHRKYEVWVIENYKSYDEFKTESGGIYLESIKDFIDSNSKTALKVYGEYESLDTVHDRFYNITKSQITLAQKTTAGIMVKFYNDISNIKKDTLARKYLE
ncbi:MAG: zinc dependent phospholipase C family protein [Clostridium sp.]